MLKYKKYEGLQLCSEVSSKQIILYYITLPRIKLQQANKYSILEQPKLGKSSAC